jgi:hypothetical protein
VIEAMHLYCTYAHGICSDRKLVPPRRTDHPDKVFRSFPPYAISRVLPCRSREGMQMLLRLTLQVCVGAGAERRALFLRAFYSVCPCAETALRVVQTRALRSRLSPKENEQRTP